MILNNFIVNELKKHNVDIEKAQKEIEEQKCLEEKETNLPAGEK
jgi:hypothetical protein